MIAALTSVRTPSSADRPVVHLVPALFDAQDGIIGGAERYVLELARHMACTVPTRLVTFGNRARTERAGGLEIKVLGDPWLVRGQRSNPASLAILREVRAARVVHCHQQHVVASSVAALAARTLRRPVFCTDLGGGGWDVSAYLSTDAWFNGHLHISEYSRRIAGHAAAPWARVVFGGVDTDRFSPPAEPVTRDTVVFVGRILPHKGINDLVDAMNPDVKAEIIGPPADARFVEELESRARGKNIVFRTTCDDADLIDAYRRAICVVLPSVYRDMYGGETKVPELLGQTLLEGMACGAPGVCTDVASLPEIVEHQVTGLVVPPNAPLKLSEALRWLCDHPIERAQMGHRARAQIVERFNWPAVVRRCLEAYAA